MRDEMKRLIEMDRERTLFSHIGALLGWDQETYIPERGVEERAEQLAIIEGLAHEKAVRPEIGDLLEALEADKSLEDVEKAYLRVARREFDREIKLPFDLVTEMARQTSLSQASWVQARKANNFAGFAPYLQKMINLNVEMAQALEPSTEQPYDVLLDLYEIGSTEDSIAKVFSVMKDDLMRILDKIRSRPQVDDSFLHNRVPASAQAAMSAYFMDAVGFDKSRGRLDTTAHPFTTTLGRDDVRITTRYIEDFFPSSIFSTIHEAGHALYEMGIDPHPDFRGTRLADAVSMAVHESQSRMWENIIGRSPEFWRKHFGPVALMAEGALNGVGADAFTKAINKVEPRLIRTEADEVTYGLHVIARFDLEAPLISGSLAVADLPAAWNAKMKELLGLEVPNDAQGCLQDVHWSMGSFGYFPSYSLGNLYAAQFWATMQETIPDLTARIEEGDCGPAREWLTKNIHKAGTMYLPGELVEKVTGSPLDASHFTRYLEKKYSEIYGF
ncbi:MAG: carboxypeptidase M32 [Spirochaetales bacterium]|jgi:carboxypeptidase Taq